MTGNLRSIISFLWDRHLSRIVGDPLEDSVVYDLSLSLPRATPETFRPWAQDVIAAALHIKVNREARDTAVWILARTKVKPAALEPGGTISDLNNLGWFPAEPPAAGGSVKLSYSDVSLIAQLLESVVKRPVLDETGITGRYDVHLSYDKSGPQGAIEALSKAGFKIEPDHRMIEFLIVTRVE
jgi:uncharacterized protein (TIGR03435 family)